MQKYGSYILALFLAAFISACGGGSTTTAPTQIYDTMPLSLATPNTHMGGAVQEKMLVLNNIIIASTFTGTAGSGTGFANYSTTNGPPAQFNRPTDITTDGTSFYVADYANNAIRKLTVSVSNAVTTVTKVETLLCTDVDTGFVTGFNGPFSLTVNPDGKQLYVVDNSTNRIRIIDLVSNKVTTIGSTEGLTGSVDSAVNTDVRFNRPTGITTDGNNLYVADSGNNTIRRIDLATKAVSTLAGTSGTIGSTDGIQGAALFNLPTRITTDGTSLYVTDFNNRTIRKIIITSGLVTTLAGAPGPLTEPIDGLPTVARFNQPNGITTDGTNLYVTDSYLNTIRKIVIATGDVSTLPIPGSTLHTPIGITTDGSSLFVADTYNVSRDPKTLVDTYSYSNSIIKID